MAILSPAVLSTPATSVTEVLALMHAVELAYPIPHGVGWFNYLYERVTQRVEASLRSASFADPDFIARLDVVFANLYFAALGAWEAGQRSPRAWKPLFATGRDAGVAPVQFALAGMNAHINRDLPVALVAVARERGGFPVRGSREKADYDRLNPILQQVETEVRASFVEDLGNELGRAFVGLDTLILGFSVMEARAAAWSHAEALWHLRDLPAVGDAYLEGLDGLVGLASRGLLVPLGRI